MNRLISFKPSHRTVILSEEVRALANLGVEGPAVAFAVACPTPTPHSTKG